MKAYGMQGADFGRYTVKRTSSGRRVRKICPCCLPKFDRGARGPKRRARAQGQAACQEEW